MPSFIVTDGVLNKLFQINHYTIPEECSLVFVGVRASLPADTDNNSFAVAQTLNTRDVDYRNMRCSILQWKRNTKEVAAFAASTVPGFNNIIGFRDKPPRNSNCLTPGFYKNYEKGKHRPKKQQNWHDAFRQNGQPLAIRRTFDNAVFDNFDEISISTGCDDNIHCGWTMDDDGANYSSAGCQVIKGIPFCESTMARQTDNLGPWKVFKDNGYSVAQTSFPYALFNSAEVFKVAGGAGKPISTKLLFGSSGDTVTQLQTILIDKNLLAGTLTGVFDTRTFNAVKKFQSDNFGKENVDGVVGPVTAGALGLDLETVHI